MSSTVSGAEAPTPAPSDAQPEPRHSLVRVLLYTGLTNAVLPLTSLATAPILARELGAHGRGEMAAVVAPMFVLIALASMSLPEAGAYAVAKLKEHPRRVLRNAGQLTLAYGVVAAVLVWVVAPAFLRNAPHLVPLLRAVVLLLPVSMWLLLVRGVLVGMRAHGVVAVERVLTPVLRLAVFVALLVTGSLTVTAAVWGHMLCSVAGGLFLAAALLRRRVVDSGEPPTAHLTRHLASYGLRGWGAVVGNLVVWRLDQVVLVALVTPRQLGYYVVAVSFAEISGMVVNSLRNVLFTESAHRDDRELIARAGRLMVVLVAGAAAVGVVLAEPVMMLLFGADFEPSVRLAQVLVLASIPFCVDQMIAAGIYAEGHPGKRSVSQVTSAAVTVGLLVLLTPSMGAMGAAVATLAAYCVACLISLVTYRRITGLPIRRMLVLERDDVHWVRGKLARVAGRLGR
ncbi:oligosaccharide flippase family protein [Nocardioides sp.]|uniref:lipopolysaccharide biosynthesis protein n=1 Tax=Nocardioides sp. TaxID=35761 RepID=UPI001A19F6F6|nr:oligosaccharide flippase family protein [Nocardioides sp.]MBJ7357702.1 oligosaccharide flippase family protein [Nocardioides sp.]